jgi:hypothetical protein
LINILTCISTISSGKINKFTNDVLDTERKTMKAWLATHQTLPCRVYKNGKVNVCAKPTVVTQRPKKLIDGFITWREVELVSDPDSLESLLELAKENEWATSILTNSSAYVFTLRRRYDAADLRSALLAAKKGEGK